MKYSAIKPPRVSGYGLLAALMCAAASSACSTESGSRTVPVADAGSLDARSNADATTAFDASDAANASGRLCAVGAPFDSISPLEGPALPQPGYLSRAQLSSDELTVYFDPGHKNISTTTRPSIGAPFGPVKVLDALTTAADEEVYFPSPAKDGLSLYFEGMKELGMSGQWEDLGLFVATRPSLGDPFGARAPVVGLSADEPIVSDDGSHIYFQRYAQGDAGGDYDIYVATGSGSAFGAPVKLAEIDSTDSEISPMPSADELEIYFWRNFAATGTASFMTAQRADPTQPFGAPVPVGGNWKHLTPIHMSLDGCRLYLQQEEDQDPQFQPFSIVVAQRSP